MRIIYTRVLALTLSILMVFSVCGSAFAASATGYNRASGSTAKPLVYVSIGDSMTNGYGMEGYDGNSGVVNYANDTYANKFAAYLAGYSGPIANDQVIFVGSNGVVDHRQLAMSGYRAEDLHWNLEFDYKNEALVKQLWENQHDGNKWEDVKVIWFGDMGFESGDYRTWTDLVDSDYRYADGAAKILDVYNNHHENSAYFSSSYATSDMLKKVSEGIAESPYFPSGTEDAATMGAAYIQIASEFFQESVKDADIISLALGNTNFGTYMLGHMTDAISGDTSKFSNRYKIEDVYALAGFDAEMEAQARSLVEECCSILEGSISGLAGNNELVKKELQYILSYCIISYIVNYVGSVDAILRLNQKDSVDIIQVALMNAYARKNTDATMEGVTLGDVVDKLYDLINAFVAALPAYMKATGNPLYQKANFYYAEADSVESMVDVYGNDFYKDKTTGEYVAYPGLDFDQSVMVANPNSIVRERFIEEEDGIVKGTAFNALAGVVKSQFGIDLRRDLIVEDIISYESMTDEEKATFAASDPATAMSIAFYLAFEHATIKAGTGTVTLDALAASSDILAALGDVFAVFRNNITTESAVYAVSVATALANIFNAGMSSSGIGFSVTAQQLLSVYTGSLTVDDLAAGIPEPAKAAVINALNSAVNNISNICLMLALPVTLSDAMIGNEAKGIARNDDVCGLLCLNARLLIGTGIGGHPSPAGHYAEYEAMKTSYEEKYTSQDKTLENLFGDDIYELVDSMAVKNADYNLTKNSSYVAFGDNKKLADSYAAYLSGEIQSKYGLTYSANTAYAIDGSRITTLAGVIAADPSVIANADLISIDYSFNKITENTLNIVFDLLANQTSEFEVPLDWEGLLGAEGAVKVKDVISKLHSELVAGGMNMKVGDFHSALAGLSKNGLTIADAMARAVEYFAYYAIEYVIIMPKMVSEIHAINPDALVMINTVYNPAAGAGIVLGENRLMFGSYFDKLIDLVYLRTALLSITEDNVVVVPSENVEVGFSLVNKNGATPVEGNIIGSTGYLELYRILRGMDSIEIASTESGDAYILEQMKNALNITLKRGDFTLDGKVTVADTVYLMQHLSNPAKYSMAQSGDVNGDGLVNRADVTYLLRNILSPAKYPLK